MYTKAFFSVLPNKILTLTASKSQGQIDKRFGKLCLDIFGVLTLLNCTAVLKNLFHTDSSNSSYSGRFLENLWSA